VPNDQYSTWEVNKAKLSSGAFGFMATFAAYYLISICRLLTCGYSRRSSAALLASDVERLEFEMTH
jgi:hypothetical protein